MLILTRKVGEALMVGDDVNITVLGVKGNQVRIGVSAPKEVAVHREEIYQRIQKEKNQATKPEQEKFEKNENFAFQMTKKKVGYAPNTGEVAERPKALPC